VGPGANNNVFDIGVVVTNPERLLVTVNGAWLFNGLGFLLSGTKLTITGPTLQSTDVVAVTSFTNVVVPNPTSFRIFQDMRGVQATYRITPSTTTVLSQPVAATDDVIHVDNASALGQPNLASNFNIHFAYNPGDLVIYAQGYYECITATTGTEPTNTTYWTPVQGAANIWGIITIGAERIMYRHRDTENNTVSGLLRGTAGTAIADHATGTNVYDMGRSNLMPITCQNYVQSNVTYPLVSGVNLGDGTTTVFTANIDISLVDNTDVVVVYVGGILIQTGYTVTATNPVTVTFTTAPAVGVEVTIMVTRAHTWYNVDTPTLPLSETDTLCARFLRGI